MWTRSQPTLSVPPAAPIGDVHLAAADERELYRRVKSLARSFPELSGCRVAVEKGASVQGRPAYRVHVDFSLPAGRVEVALPPGARDPGHELTEALVEAFERARRALVAHGGPPAPRAFSRLF